MEHANSVQIDHLFVHRMNERRYQLDELIESRVNCPVSLADNFSEEVSTISYAYHGVSELGVAKYLRVTQRVLIGQEDLKSVTLYPCPDGFLSCNGCFIDRYMDGEASDGII